MVSKAKFTEEEKTEIMTRACEKIAEGHSFFTLSESGEFPSNRTMFRWVRQREDLNQMYRDALEDRAERLAQELLDLADSVDDTSSTSVQAARLRTDVRKWLIEKQAPKVYGAKQSVELSGDVKIDYEGVLEAARRRRESGKEKD